MKSLETGQKNIQRYVSYLWRRNASTSAPCFIRLTSNCYFSSIDPNKCALQCDRLYAWRWSKMCVRASCDTWDPARGVSRCGRGSWGLEPSSHVHFGELAIASLLAATERPVNWKLCVSLRKGRMLGDRGRSPYQHHCHLYVGLTIFKTYQLFTMCKLYHNHPLQY